MGGLLVGGLLFKTVGWRVLAVSGQFLPATANPDLNFGK